jgi:hypothetical protein
VVARVLFSWWGTSTTKCRIKLSNSCTFKYRQMCQKILQQWNLRYYKEFLSFYQDVNVKSIFSQNCCHSIGLLINIRRGIDWRVKRRKTLLIPVNGWSLVRWYFLMTGWVSFYFSYSDILLLGFVFLPPSSVLAQHITFWRQPQNTLINFLAPML